MRLAICDDDPAHIRQLEELLAAHTELVIETEPYHSGPALLQDLRDNARRYDAYFLDMEMPGMSGFETADALRAIDDTALVVFVTSHAHYVFESFRCSPVYFLPKPIDPAMLDQALALLQRRLADRSQYVTFSERGKHLRLRCDDILYVESSDHTLLFHTKHGATHRVRQSMKTIQTQLDGTRFCRVHRSYLVNLHHLTAFHKDHLHLAHCETIIPVGDGYRTALYAAILRLKERENQV